MENYKLKCEANFDKDTILKNKALCRFVLYQIRSMLKDESQLIRIIHIDETGALMLNPNTRLLTNDQKDIISRLINNFSGGIYRDHQFKDLDRTIDAPYSYRQWFEYEAMESFMHTIPTREIFYNNPLDLNIKLTDGQHSKEELKRESFGGYSIYQTLYALDMINPFLIATLLGHNQKIERDSSGFEYMAFKYKDSDTYYYVRLDSINIYCKDNCGIIHPLEDITIYSFLFEHYHQPIFKVISSIMEPIANDKIIPYGKLEDSKNKYLTHEVYQVLQSDNYQKLDKKYEISRRSNYWL